MILTLNHLSGILGYKREEIDQILAEKEKYFYQFSKVKKGQNNLPIYKNGIKKSRHFSPSKDDLRNIHNKLRDKVLVKVPLIPNIKGGVRGNSTAMNAKFHKGKHCIFQTDLSNFFPSVSKSMVISTLRNKGFSKQVATRIAELSTFEARGAYRKECLPQGAPTSSYLANMVFEKIDKKLLRILKGHNISYTRWLDDLSFSAYEDISRFIPDIIKIISDNGFKVSGDKTTFRLGTALIAGIVTTPNSLKPTNDFREKGKGKLAEKQKQGRKAYRNHIYWIDKQYKLDTSEEY